MRKLRILLAALLITIFIMPYSATRAESTETPVDMSISIMQDSTEAVVGETITASWTYTAALPVESCGVQLFMFCDDGTSECILLTYDQSVTSFSYTPTKAGQLDLNISVRGADGRHLSKDAQWKITGASTTPEDTVPMTIDIVQDSTEAVVGETITASWTYTAALPVESCGVQLFMFCDDGTSECILLTYDQSVTSFSYTPTKAGQLDLNISVRGADGRHLSKDTQWTITKGAVPSKAPGDANNDGATNIDDAIAILQHLTGNNASINLSNADINGDSKVNSNDVLVILQRAAGWN